MFCFHFSSQDYLTCFSVAPVCFWPYVVLWENSRQLCTSSIDLLGFGIVQHFASGNDNDVTSKIESKWTDLGVCQNEILLMIVGGNFAWISVIGGKSITNHSLPINLPPTNVNPNSTKYRRSCH